MIKFLKKHYHWIIAVVLFLVTCVRGGAANNLTGQHLIPVTADRSPGSAFVEKS